MREIADYSTRAIHLPISFVGDVSKGKERDGEEISTFDKLVG